MPAGYDAEVAELFRDLRAASGLSETDLASQLATRIEVVQALEQGAIYALPAWPETYRVVATYGTLLNLDVRPLLRRIYAQVEAGIVELAPKPIPDVPFMAPPEGTDRELQRQTRPSAPPAAEPYAVQPRRTANPPPKSPPPAQDWRAPPRQPGMPSQPRTQGQPRPHPHAQPRTGPPPLPRATPPRQAQPGAAPQPPPRAAPPPAQPRATPPQPRAQSRAASAQGQPKVGLAPQAAPATSKPAKTARPRGWLKWAVVGVVVLAGVVGLWMWLAGPSLLGSGPSPSASQPSGSSTDPNDPRSRKADRLPSP